MTLAGRSRTQPLALLAFVATGIVVASCGSDRPAALHTLVDSAGVSIVTNDDIDTTAIYQWPFPTEPAVRIGVVEGDSAYQLFNVMNAYRRRDGSVVVANAGSGEIRFYDRNGRHLRSVGRSGKGPGEYVSLRWAQQYRGDSIVSLDGATNRVTISDAEGRYGRSFRPVAPGERPLAIVVVTLHDGSFLARYGGRTVTLQDSTRVERPATKYGLWTPNGEFVREFGVFMGREEFIWSDGRSLSAGNLPFGRKTTISILGDYVLVADNTAPEILLFEQDGQLAGIVRAPWTRPSLSERDAEADRQERLASIEPSPFAQVSRATVRAIPYPELLPYYEEIVVDADRNMWVQGPAIPGRGSDRWLVFSEDGTYTGWIAIPRSLRVTHIDSNAIVGIATDDLGVQYIEVYKLERPQ